MEAQKAGYGGEVQDSYTPYYNPYGPFSKDPQPPPSYPFLIRG